MKNKIIYILLVVTAFASCKKVELDVPIDTPVFSVDATVDGLTLDWSAGDDDFYMFTEFSKDNLEVYTLTGRLAKDSSCVNDCEESLTFSIRGNAITPSINDFNIDQAIMLNTALGYKKMDTLSMVEIIETYTFEGLLVDAINGNPTANYFWLINGDTLSGQTVNYNSTNVSNIDFSVEMTDNFGCTASYAQFNLDSFSDCNLDIEVSGGNGNFSIVPTFSNGAFPLNTWNNNPINTDSSFEITPNNQFGNELFLTTTDSIGLCTLDVKMCLEQDSLGGGMIVGVKVPQISYSIQQDTIPDPIDNQFSKVEIQYQDATGTYSSFNGENDNSTFTITKVENFEDNENGEKTKVLTIDYDAVLYNTQGVSKTIIGTGVIGVAYPE